MENGLSVRIRDLRVGKQWSQKHFGEQIGVSQPIVTQMETGKRTFWPNTILQKIASVFGVSTESLLEGLDDIVYEQDMDAWRTKAQTAPPDLEEPVAPITKPTKLEPSVRLEPVIYTVQRFTGKVLTEEEILANPDDVIEVIPFLTAPARVSVQAMCSMQVSYGTEGGGGEWRGWRFAYEMPCYREEMEAVKDKLIAKVKDEINARRRELASQAAVDYWGEEQRKSPNGEQPAEI